MRGATRAGLVAAAGASVPLVSARSSPPACPPCSCTAVTAAEAQPTAPRAPAPADRAQAPGRAGRPGGTAPIPASSCPPGWAPVLLTADRRAAAGRHRGAGRAAGTPARDRTRRERRAVVDDPQDQPGTAARRARCWPPSTPAWSSSTTATPTRAGGDRLLGAAGGGRGRRRYPARARRHPRPTWSPRLLGGAPGQPPASWTASPTSTGRPGTPRTPSTSGMRDQARRRAGPAARRTDRRGRREVHDRMSWSASTSCSTSASRGAAPRAGRRAPGRAPALAASGLALLARRSGAGALAALFAAGRSPSRSVPYLLLFRRAVLAVRDRWSRCCLGAPSAAAGSRCRSRTGTARRAGEAAERGRAA